MLRKVKSSYFISTVSVFAALTIVCDSILESPLPSSGVWLSWIFLIEPINGILLSPYASFLATFIGVMVGHSIRFRGFEEFIFTIGAPFGALITSLLVRRKWKKAFIYYALLLGAYFLTPVSWKLPLWGMWDVYLAFFCLLLVILIINLKSSSWSLKFPHHILVLALSTFIGLEADVLFRIFIFVPCQMYWIYYGFTEETLYSIWAVGAVETPIKAGISTLITLILVPSIIKAVGKSISQFED